MIIRRDLLLPSIMEGNIITLQITRATIKSLSDLIREAFHQLVRASELLINIIL